MNVAWPKRLQARPREGRVMAFDALSRTPKLTTVQNVGIEISRIYRATKRGKISTPDGYRMVQMLAVLKSCLS